MIDPILYKNYSDCISFFYSDENDISNLLLEMYNDITLIDSSLTNISPFDFSSIINKKYLSDKKEYIDQYVLADAAVSALQSHVIRYYGDLNKFLKDNSILVNYYFAQASNRLGFVIDDNNIEYVFLDNGETYIVS